ncbi:MAG TPA: hypothetical protein VMA36_04590 [Candidatus Limnocylindria bacterium]|nr:hypothetical protein [Candidatus Limnocylindria bacterium]
MLVVLLIVALAVGGHLLFRRYVPPAVLRRQNDVVGFTVSIVGVLYAVVLGFVVIVVWEEFGMAQDVVRREVTTATSLQADSLVFGGRAHIATDLGAYAQAVACEEWDAMQYGKEGPRASAAIARLVRDVTSVEPRGERERIAYGDSLSLVHQQLALRSERLVRNGGGLEAILWLSLSLGAAITIGFTYLLGAANFRLQLVATGLLGMLIGVMFSLIIALDYPFRGVVHVSAEPWLVFAETLTGRPVSCTPRDAAL